MFKTAMDASNETNPNYWIYKGILSDGWIFGRKVDNSDSQYRFFRDNFLLLGGMVLLHQILRRVSFFFKVRRTLFDLVYGVSFLFVAHGFNFIRIIFHVSVMYFFGTFVSSRNKKLALILLWSYGIGTLFLNDKYRQVKFGQIMSSLSFMDSFRGIIERWDVFFNFTLLKMLSFNLDFIKRNDDLLDGVKNTSNKAKTSSEEESIPLREASESQPVTPNGSPSTKYLNERQRLDYPLEISDYNYMNYLSYVTYTPLLIAGPIMTFNDYMYQTRFTLPSINWKRTLVYGLRLGFYFGPFVMASIHLKT
ncbi:unnamed protein product [Ambrosiozyma monospora]|uniref:Unnamed protein product n=1 Tax=Ambrosiozyma monospora TaxID=43982 RepID=A0ACB5TS68_AMBMO|nr:unnamed protein product [Ambrosiozyma monospora]